MDNVINWKDKKLVVCDKEKVPSVGGRLDKFWVEDITTHKIYMCKGTGWFGYEPFSEKMAYIIGKNLGLDILEYDIIPAELFKGKVNVNNKCRYLSICEKIDNNDCKLISVTDIKKQRNLEVKSKGIAITNRQVMYEILPKIYVDLMLIYDAIIGNTDRHYGNIHILKNRHNEYIGAPILDNGASLLANTLILKITIFKNSIGKKANKSYTLEDNHNLQMKYIDELEFNCNIPVITIDTLHELDPVIKLLPKYRQRIVKRYIVFRIRKYLSLYKRFNKDVKSQILKDL